MPPEPVPVREDFLDYPTAWQIQREVGESLEHDPRCSSVPKPNARMGDLDRLAGPGLLCDCGAVEREWKRRVSDQREARDQAAHQHMIQHDDPFGGLFDINDRMGWGPGV